MLKTKKEIAYAVGIVLALIAAIVVIAVGAHLRHRPAGTDATSSPARRRRPLPRTRRAS